MKQKTLILLTAFLLVSVFASAENSKSTVQIKWFSNLEDALAEAEISQLPIFIDFTGSDWCGWCFKLEEEVFSKQDFINYVSENLIMVKLDYPKRIEQTFETKQYNNEIASKFGIRGFPTILLLDENGKEISRTGYQPGGAMNYISHIKSLLKGKQ